MIISAHEGWEPDEDLEAAPAALEAALVVDFFVAAGIKGMG